MWESIVAQIGSHAFLPPPPPPKLLVILLLWALFINYSSSTFSVFPDIDECSINSNICGSGSNCTNFEGGYDCTCGPGYDPTADRRSCIGTCYFNTWLPCFLVLHNKGLEQCNLLQITGGSIFFISDLGLLLIYLRTEDNTNVISWLLDSPARHGWLLSSNGFGIKEVVTFFGN